ncbi:hypothetical protein HOY80DRAFT_961451 [Tuber brumale]|nr:hypothetical protein HOY80DRAFT_961451 [Tuber brumale]
MTLLISYFCHFLLALSGQQQSFPKLNCLSAIPIFLPCHNQSGAWHQRSTDILPIVAFAINQSIGTTTTRRGKTLEHQKRLRQLIPL